MKRIVNQELIDLIVKNKVIANPIDDFNTKLSDTYVNTQLTEIDVRLSGVIRRQRRVDQVTPDTLPTHQAREYNWDDIWGDKESVIDSGSSLIFLAPGEMILGETVEGFNLPENIIGEFSLRSWAAKSGLNQSTSLTMKPNWNGYLVLELHNCLKDRWLCFEPGAVIGQVSFYSIKKRGILEWLLGKK